MYHKCLHVFDKQGVDTLLKYLIHDSIIKLLPGTGIPWLYHLFSEFELSTLREYIDENIQKGFTHPSITPVGAGIFFEEKKDQILHPCIDNQVLNKSKIKNCCLFLLVSELFQRFRPAKIFFTKLDLWGAYNLVRILNCLFT